MKFEVRIDPHCGDCHGKGEITFDEWKDGECWIVSVACPCVTYHHDDEMKAFLAKATQSAPALRPSHLHAETLPKREPAGVGADTTPSISRPERQP